MMGATVNSTLRYLESLPDHVRDSPLAQAALRLAEGLDDPHHSFTSRSMGAKAFQDVLRDLREQAPAEVKDQIDELSSRRRRRRRERGATTAD